MKSRLWCNNTIKNITEAKKLQENKESIDNLKNENAKLQHELEIANAKIKWYEEQLKLNALKKYGKSDDKVEQGQVSFFNEAEITARAKIQELKYKSLQLRKLHTKEKRKEELTNHPSMIFRLK